MLGYLFRIWLLLIATQTYCQAENFAQQREQMVREEIAGAGVNDPRVLAAVRATPRHEFVPGGFRHLAYQDVALPIGDQQTISPPYIVAYMTEQLDPQPDDRVLEIGTGSGYQAAILSPLVNEVYTIEIVESLGKRAERKLKSLGYDNVQVRVGDGFAGWPEAAPFDKIIVTCSPENIPPALGEQLKEGGQLIIPVGERYQQNLYRVTKRNGKLTREALQATLFVPMTGAAEEARQVIPDPTKPAIVNGSFEQVLNENENDALLPVGWHYLRDAKVSQNDAPHGKRYLTFKSNELGRASRALQGLAIDGREVREIEISAIARGRNLKPGLFTGDRPCLQIAFFDGRRAVIENRRLGKWEGSFSWTKTREVLRVPPATREAIVRLGLQGGTGRLDIDAVRLEPIQSGH